MEGQWNERLESTGLVLQRTRTQHVIDALLHRLDVAIQHRDVGAQPEPMRDAMNVEIPLGAALVAADLLAHALGKDLRAATGQRVQTRRHQLAQHLRVGHAIEIREECDLDCGETLQVDAGTNAFEAAQQVRVVHANGSSGFSPLTMCSSVSG